MNQKVLNFFRLAILGVTIIILLNLVSTGKDAPRDNVNNAYVVPIETHSRVIQEESADRNNKRNSSTEKIHGFIETFEANKTVYEAPSELQSSSEMWWVNSGAFMQSINGIGGTIQGDLAADSLWREKYVTNKAERTANGFRPQNIFRLLTRDHATNSSGELEFKITLTDSTDSKERAGSNGVLLFGRYMDSDNLYYAGLRVDGDLVIKKKTEGEYYTLSQKNVYQGEYNKDLNPNLIPENEWMKIKADFVNLDDYTVMITLYFDSSADGIYDDRIVAVDDGHTYGGSAFTDEGHFGIRTDFMDVQFENFVLKTIN